MSQAMSNQKLSDEELEVKLVELQRVIVERGDMPENIGSSSTIQRPQTFLTDRLISDRILLLRFLKFFNGNVEKALRRLITNMELRKSYSNIFYNRDTLDPNLRKLIEQV